MIKKYIAYVDFGGRLGLPEQKLVGPFDSHEAHMKKSELEDVEDVGKAEVIEIDVDSGEYPLMGKHSF